ncbi:unnamed protein product, partial [Prorocentrum cordatum]
GRRRGHKSAPALAPPISAASRWGADPSEPRNTVAREGGPEVSEFQQAMRTSPSEGHRRLERGLSFAAPNDRPDTRAEAIAAAVAHGERMKEVDRQIAEDEAALMAEVLPDDREVLPDDRDWQHLAADEEDPGGKSEPAVETLVGVVASESASDTDAAQGISDGQQIVSAAGGSSDGQQSAHEAVALSPTSAPPLAHHGEAKEPCGFNAINAERGGSHRRAKQLQVASPPPESKEEVVMPPVDVVRDTSLRPSWSPDSVDSGAPTLRLASYDNMEDSPPQDEPPLSDDLLLQLAAWMKDGGAGD